MTNPFWNKTEKRPRMLIRLSLFILMSFLLSLGGIFISGEFIEPNLSSESILLNTPAPNYDTLYSALMTPAITLIGAFLAMVSCGRLFERRSLSRYGLKFNRRWGADLIFGLALGAMLMGIIYFVELALGWVTVTQTSANSIPEISFSQSILVSLATYICVGIYEELIFRGELLRNIAEGLNFKFIGSKAALWIAWIGSSLIFGIVHATNPNSSAVSTINIVAAGIFLALGFLLTGDLGISIGLHITWNFFQGSIFGFPVSGTESTATLIAIQQNGPDLLTGGAFGPEGGLIGLVAMFIGCLLIYFYVRYTRSRADLQYDLAVFQPPAPRQVKSSGEAAEATSKELE